MTDVNSGEERTPVRLEHYTTKSLFKSQRHGFRLIVVANGESIYPGEAYYRKSEGLLTILGLVEGVYQITETKGIDLPGLPRVDKP